jgi:hypothetical protein
MGTREHSRGKEIINLLFVYINKVNEISCYTTAIVLRTMSRTSMRTLIITLLEASSVSLDAYNFTFVVGSVHKYLYYLAAIPALYHTILYYTPLY